MSGVRNIILATGEIYHVFNRGIDRREVFTDKKEYHRALNILNFYRFANLPIRYSHFQKLANDRQEKVLSNLHKLEVTVIAYCLMPNHFHLVLRQEKEGGISRFVSNLTNSFVRYSNTKHKRKGYLFEGPFNSVRVESDEQLLHLVRYIHLNPIVGFIIKESELDSYPYSSHREYLNPSNEKNISNSSLILDNFKNTDSYNQFLHDQINYAKELKKIQHLLLEGV